MNILRRLATGSALALSLIAGVGATDAHAVVLDAKAAVLADTITRIDYYPDGTRVVYWKSGVVSVIYPQTQT